MVSHDGAPDPQNTGSAESWKTRYTAARLARDRARQDAEEARRAASIARHEILEPTVVQFLLAHRARTMVARARTPPALERERAFKASCAAYAAPDDGTPPTETSIVDGLTWRVPAAPPGAALQTDWLEKQRRFPYQAILQTRDVSIGGLMLDVGANVGRVSIPRVVFGDITAAYCAEPDPVNYYCLRRNVLDNGLAGFVMPDRVAIGDRDGCARLSLAKKYTGHHVAWNAGSEARSIEVPMCTLDTWVRCHDIDLEAVTFIKVDVEGYEQRVLSGAGRVLSQTHVAWQLEVWPRHLSAAGDSVAQLAATLAAHFTHYVDLRRDVPAPRVRPIGEIHAMAADLEQRDAKTDVVVFHA